MKLISLSTPWSLINIFHGKRMGRRLQKRHFGTFQSVIILNLYFINSKNKSCSNLQRTVIQMPPMSVKRSSRRHRRCPCLRRCWSYKQRCCRFRFFNKGALKIVSDITLSMFCCLIFNVFYCATLFWSHVRSPEPMQQQQNVKHSFKKNQVRHLSNLTVNIS